MLPVVFAFLLLQAGHSDSPSLEGVAVHAVTGEPVKKAQVRLRRADGTTSLVATTDVSGRFVFQQIEPAHYRLSATRTGFVPYEHGAKSGTPGVTLNLSSGLHLRDLTLKLTPLGVITGRVVSDDGERLGRASVTALVPAVTRGKRHFQSVSSTTTNDLGEYRLFDMIPGRYFVMVNYEHRSAESYQPLYYPNVTDGAQAVAVHVPPGAEVSGIDFTLSVTRTFRVRGKVISRVSGDPIANTTVTLVSRAEHMDIVRRNVVRTAAAGTFELVSVAPGNYWLVCNQYSDNRQLYGRTLVEVLGQNVDDVTLAAGPAFEVRGRVRLEGDRKLDPKGLSVQLLSHEPGWMSGGATARIEADGAFTIKGVTPDDYFVEVGGLRGDLYFKGVFAGRENLIDTGLNLTGGVAPDGLEIVVASNAGSLDGAVSRGSEPAQGVNVVLVPEPAARRSRYSFYKIVSADAAGRFHIPGVAPGNYRVYAGSAVNLELFQDPDYLKANESQSKLVTVREGSRESVQLTLSEQAPAQVP